MNLTVNTQWAMNTCPASAPQKIVLLVLAYLADADGRCSPTIENLEVMTCMNVRTVRKALEALVDQGYVKDTGKRIGLGGNTKIWQMVRATA